jgi:hypothetical protein
MKNDFMQNNFKFFDEILSEAHQRVNHGAIMLLAIDYDYDFNYHYDND